MSKWFPVIAVCAVLGLAVWSGSAHSKLQQASIAWSSETEQILCGYWEHYEASDGYRQAVVDYYAQIDDAATFGVDLDARIQNRLLNVRETRWAIHQPLIERGIDPSELEMLCREDSFGFRSSFLAQLELCSSNDFGRFAYSILPYHWFQGFDGKFSRDRLRLVNSEVAWDEEPHQLPPGELKLLIERVNENLPEIFSHFGYAIVCR